MNASVLLKRRPIASGPHTTLTQLLRRVEVRPDGALNERLQESKERQPLWHSVLCSFGSRLYPFPVWRVARAHEPLVCAQCRSLLIHRKVRNGHARTYARAYALAHSLAHSIPPSLIHARTPACPPARRRRDRDKETLEDFRKNGRGTPLAPLSHYYNPARCFSSNKLFSSILIAVNQGNKSPRRILRTNNMFRFG